jgi:hypothetical protein
MVRFIWRRPARLHPDRLQGAEVLADRLAVHPGAAGNRPDTLAALPSPHNLAKLHHPQLPIGHRHPPFRGSIGRQAGVAECFRSGGG